MRRFLLLFTFFWCESFDFWSFSLHSRVLFFVSLLYSVSVCVGGGVVSRLFLDARWRLPIPIPPVGLVFFNLVFCFLFLPVWDNFCFCLHSCDQKFSTFDRFPCILECCFYFSLLSSEWGGEGRLDYGKGLWNFRIILWQMLIIIYVSKMKLVTIFFF